VLDGDVVERLAGELGHLERGRVGNEQRTEPIDRFPLFVLLALSLLSLDLVLARTAGGGMRWRRRARVPAVALLVLVLAAFGIGELERGNRLYRAGRYQEAAAAYREALRADGKSAVLRYNLGTALLQLGQLDEAEREFQLALASVEPSLRQRTLFNLGNRHLLEGRRGSENQERRLEAAIAAYRRALRIDPDDAAAKWNLELALRERERQQQQRPQQSEQEESEAEPQKSGGGGSSQQQPSGEQGETGEARQERPMSQAEAERILSAAEQDERDLAREKLRRGQRRTPVLRDW
jgi:tetratricopeptide (TPR) repeat protein